MAFVFDRVVLHVIGRREMEVLQAPHLFQKESCQQRTFSDVIWSLQERERKAGVINCVVELVICALSSS